MFIVGTGRFRLIMTVGMCNLVVYVALASWLVPRYEAPGAALATTVMEGVNAILQ
jgi:O-antigen/teichoic acid export membrane protein